MFRLFLIFLLLCLTFIDDDGGSQIDQFMLICIDTSAVMFCHDLALDSCRYHADIVKYVF